MTVKIQLRMTMMKMIVMKKVEPDSKIAHVQRMNQLMIKNNGKKQLKMPKLKSEKIKCPNILRSAKKNKESKRNKHEIHIHLLKCKFISNHLNDAILLSKQAQKL